MQITTEKAERTQGGFLNPPPAPKFPHQSWSIVHASNTRIQDFLLFLSSPS